jgi:hypothetical protein
MRGNKLGVALSIAIVAAASACGSDAKLPLCSGRVSCVPTTASGTGGDSTTASGSGGAPELLWAEQVGDADDQQPLDVSVDSQGAVLVTGYFQGAIPFKGAELKATNAADIFIAKLDPGDRHAIWAASLGESFTLVAEPPELAIEVGSNDAIVAAGTFTSSIQFNGGTNVTNPTPKSADVYVVKLDSSGKQLWLRTFATDSAGAKLGDIALDANGDVLVTGTFRTKLVPDAQDPSKTVSGNGVFVAKLGGADGKVAWSSSLTGNDGNSAQGRGVAVAPNGEMTVVGHFAESITLPDGKSMAATKDDGLIIRLDAGGAFKWAKQLSGATYDRATSVIDSGDQSGDFVVAGTFVESIDLGKGPFQASPARPRTTCSSRGSVVPGS